MRVSCGATLGSDQNCRVILYGFLRGQKLCFQSLKVREVRMRGILWNYIVAKSVLLSVRHCWGLASEMSKWEKTMYVVCHYLVVGRAG